MPVPRSRLPRLLPMLALALVLAAFPLGTLASHDFADVPDSNVFHADISALAASGVTTGCGGGNYCPSAFVTREQMAAFMNRLGALAVGKVPVVNAATAQDADALDGIDSAQFARADLETTGHVNCHAYGMVPRESTYGFAALNSGRYITSGSNAQFTCNLVFPDGATVTAIRGLVFDSSPTFEAGCSMLNVSLTTGAVSVMANTTPTGVIDEPGFATVDDLTIDSALIDNAGFAYLGQCGLTGVSAQLRIHGLSIEYTVTGLPLP